MASSCIVFCIDCSDMLKKCVYKHMNVKDLHLES